MTFDDALQIDSLTMVEVVVACEERFGVRIPDAFARFDREPLERSGGDLLLRRYDTSFRFAKVRP